jgi:hypothetical protein
MKKQMSLLAVLLILFQCKGPEVYVKKGFNLNDSQKKYAILNFSYSGESLTSKLALKTADRFASLLYIKRKLSVIDRSLVKAAVIKFGIKANDRLSLEDISKLKKELNADYLILGNLHSTASARLIDENRQTDLSLNIRILTAENGDAQAMAYWHLKTDNNVSVTIEALIKKIIDRLNDNPDIEDENKPNIEIRPAVVDSGAVSYRNKTAPSHFH